MKSCANCSFYEGDQESGVCNVLPCIRISQSEADGDTPAGTIDIESWRAFPYGVCMFWQPAEDGVVRFAADEPPTLIGGLYAIAKGLHAIADAFHMDNVSHAICMGIRHRLFGADADSWRSILEMRQDNEYD